MDLGALSLLETRRVDGLFSEADLVSLWLLALEARWVDSCTADTNFLLIGGGLEAGRVYGSTDTDFLTVAWLEAGTVFTLGDVDLGTFVSTTLRAFDVDSGVVMVMSTVREFELEVG